MIYILIINFIFSFSVFSQEDLGSVDAIGISPLPGILIDKTSCPFAVPWIGKPKLTMLFCKLKEDGVLAESVAFPPVIVSW